MRKLSSLLIVMICSISFVHAIPLNPNSDISVARAGSFVDTFNNPAALPFRSAGEGNFLLSAVYSDEADLSIYGEKLGIFQTSQGGFLLSFGGRNAMFTLGLGHDLENRSYSGDRLTYDLYFRMHFQLDLAYNLGPLSFGFRFQGGSSMIRNNREIDSLYDFATNLYFSQFYDNPGSEYFILGLGLMWYDDWFTVGANADNVISAQGGDVVFIAENLSDSLDIGASFHLPRFRRDGELRLIRPVLSLQLGDLTSTDSYLMGSVELDFQLLPDTDVGFRFAHIAYRDAKVNWFATTRQDEHFTLFLEIGSWAVEANLVIPFELYSGSSSRAASFTLALRFNPR